MMRFNDRQSLRDSARTLQSTLKSAATRAKIGDVPSACFDAAAKLTGYRVTLIQGTGIVTVEAMCGAQIVLVDQFSLPNFVVSDTTATLVFWPLYGGVQGATVITLEKAPLQYQFEVTTEGEITDGDFE